MANKKFVVIFRFKKSKLIIRRLAVFCPVLRLNLLIISFDFDFYLGCCGSDGDYESTLMKSAA